MRVIPKYVRDPLIKLGRLYKVLQMWPDDFCYWRPTFNPNLEAIQINASSTFCIRNEAARHSTNASKLCVHVEMWASCWCSEVDSQLGECLKGGARCDCTIRITWSTLMSTLMPCSHSCSCLPNTPGMRPEHWTHRISILVILRSNQGWGGGTLDSSLVDIVSMALTRPPMGPVHILNDLKSEEIPSSLANGIQNAPDLNTASQGSGLCLMDVLL